MKDSPIDPQGFDFQDPAMSELIVIGLCSIAGLLVLILVVLIRIAARLKGIERRLTKSRPSVVTEKETSSVASYDGAFGKFIGERPELLVLKKSEQFAAFRKWRKEQGLNWEGK